MTVATWGPASRALGLWLKRTWTASTRAAPPGCAGERRASSSRIAASIRSTTASVRTRGVPWGIRIRASSSMNQNP